MILGLGHPEVEELHHAALVHHHVVGFDVPMDHPQAVGVLEGIAEGQEDPDRHGKRQAAMEAKELIDGAPLHVLHGDEEDPLVVARIEIADDVGMVEATGRASPRAGSDGRKASSLEEALEEGP